MHISVFKSVQQSDRNLIGPKLQFIYIQPMKILSAVAASYILFSEEAEDSELNHRNCIGNSLFQKFRESNGFTKILGCRDPRYKHARESKYHLKVC